MEKAGITPGLFFSEHRSAAGRCACMTQRPAQPDDLITEPLTPEAVDGVVVVRDPPEAAMSLTADAADISAIRMLEAAERARKQQ